MGRLRPVASQGGLMALPSDGWKPREESLRKSEISIQKWTGIAQVVLSIATIAAVLVAGYVAYQGQQALKVTTQYNLQQGLDNQLSTALTSLGSSDTTERIAGLVLLRRNATDRLMPRSIAVFGEQSALSYYRTALKVFSGYLSSHGKEFLASHRGDAQPFGLGYGKFPPLGVLDRHAIRNRRSEANAEAGKRKVRGDH